MFNFSANHVTVVSSIDYPKCTVYIVKDLDTKRCYKVYDYSKASGLSQGYIYRISGKVNAADKLYLVLENHKMDQNFDKNGDSVAKVQNINGLIG